MLSEQIKNYRKENSLTQQQLADKLFVTRSAVAKWEQGRGFPSKDILENISSLLGTSTEELLSEKEIRFLAVENAIIVKKHKKYLFFLFPLIALLILSVFILFSISLTPKEPIVPPIIYTKDAYNVAKVEGNLLTFNVERNADVIIDLADENNQNIECTSKQNSIYHLKDIKNGYRLKVNYTYSSETESYTVNSIKIIDDYIENDYYIYGFFLSTKEYDGSSAPVYATNDPNYYYELNGALSPISDQYPFAEISYNSMRYSVLNFHSSYLTSAGIKEYSFSLSTDINVEKIFIYALDNSEKGFTLYSNSILVANQTEILLKKGAIFNENCKDDNYKQPYKTDCSFRIIINKISKPSLLKLTEYDSNHNLVKTTRFTTYEQVFNTTYKLQQSTNYVEVVQNLNACGIFTKNTSLSATLKNIYGFILNTSLSIS